MYYKYINNHLLIMDFGSAELFQTANIPTEHFLRTELSLKLHPSFNHKNVINCVSPILLTYAKINPPLRSLLCETREHAGVCFRTAPQKPSWLNKHTGSSCWTKVCSRAHTSAGLFWTFIQRETGLTSFFFPSRFIRLVRYFVLGWLQILFCPNTSLNTPYSTLVIPTPSDPASLE